MTNIAPSMLNKTTVQLRRQIADAERLIAHLNHTIAIARTLLLRLRTAHSQREDWEQLGLSDQPRPSPDKDR